MPPGWQERFGIEVVPLNVVFGSQTFRDRVDLGDDEFFAKLEEASRLPTTAAPAPGDFAAAYERLSRECEGVISIHLGGQLSGTVDAARVGARAVEGFPVRVIDSRSLTMCVAFLCRVAAEAPSLEDAVNRVEERVPKLRIIALLDTLRYVEMGGRVSRAQAMIGTMLDLKPILRVADGEIGSLDRVRTRNRAIPRLLELLLADAPLEQLAVMHAVCLDDAERVRADLRRALPDLDIELGQIGPVLGAHVGPRALGMAYVKS